MFEEKDLAQFEQRGVTAVEVQQQVLDLKNGYPQLNILCAATIPQQIKAFTAVEIEKYVRIWHNYLAQSHKVVKFVPASGAASRMFKELFEALNDTENKPQSKNVTAFFDNIKNFAFFDKFNEMALKYESKSIEQLINEGEYKKVLSLLLLPQYLGYGSLPKGLLLFHRYADEVRTPIAEHIVEGLKYAKSNDGKVRIHFTVSPEHIELFREHCQMLQDKMDADCDITFSIQKPSTDTVAIDKKGNLYRNEDGSLLFRPGGHGALIENLNDIDADVVFIKNIDNVVPDKIKGDTILFKEVIAGKLVDIQAKIFDILSLLESGKFTESDLEKIIDFARVELNIEVENIHQLDSKKQADCLFKLLNRPIRVCGMVLNEGEPGGGPFMVKNGNGVAQLQILESSQIPDKKKNLMKEATHFNPVDLVCALKDYKNNAFYLPQYVDKMTGFISQKSVKGVDIKVLERPGLWNGAMSDWNTIFVQVPISTFNPVKTINDLLREQHQ